MWRPEIQAWGGWESAATLPQPQSGASGRFLQTGVLQAGAVLRIVGLGERGIGGEHVVVGDARARPVSVLVSVLRTDTR